LAPSVPVVLEMLLGGSVAVGVWVARAWSLLLGGLCVVLPAWGYAALTRSEHRPAQLLLLAWVKIFGTVGLLALVISLVAPQPLWVLAGLVAAYIGHGLAALAGNDRG